MNAVQDLSFIELISHAHILVKLIMALLFAVSLISWTYIFRKVFALRAARRQTEQFERSFWAGGNLHTLHQSASSQRDQSGPLARIFEAGMGEFIKGKQASRDALDVGAVLDGARRAMRAAFHRELDMMDTHLNFLASVGSVSPYIGLLGTVWGIMNAFRGLASVQQATLATVAPGIAEALIATAIGLFAAIPAVVAYNRFTHDIDRLAIRFESFVEEFSNILQRQSR
ncbi:protein TolQ [Massilia forsythiae]|uniref:Tol-Pal system protein TolQ n=1 Tax=Massilia forsythiae TaxID=2728020 RepID=A0A7Z2VT85_9BURK|nr:protein TolQ [Massilia forsythiae]QJD98682.1 protein TolQ [Massilia forsythiae]